MRDARISRNSCSNKNKNYTDRKNGRKFSRMEEIHAEFVPTKIKVGVWLSKSLWKEFRELVFAKHGNFHGALSYEVEEALRNWLGLHTQIHTKINSINPAPRAKQVWEQVKDYIRQRQGFVGQQVTLELLTEAISAVRGSDPRTIKKWLKEFQRYRLIKHIAGHVWEVV